MAFSINPGGQVSPEETLGRDELITELWGILSAQSIYMNDLRRIGKTQIMKKMNAQPRAGWASVYRDVSSCTTAAEFATLAYRLSAEMLSGTQRNLRRMGNLLGKMAGAEIAGILKLPDGSAVPWKEVLSRTFADIDEAMVARGDEAKMVFFWDEIPYLIGKIAKNDSPAVAMDVLDVLRALGQDHDRVRLFLSGSIGLHHVLHSLRQNGYNGSPLNRMAKAQPGPLAAPESETLARGLMEGSGRKFEDVDACVTALTSAVGHVPFYIHKLVSRLPKDQSLTPQLIESTLDREIRSDQNDWDLQHYRNRIDRYYEGSQKIVLAILDTVAVGQPMNLAAILKDLASQMDADQERVRRLLKLLCLDHYLMRDEANRYRFYLDIIRRWWRLERDL
ncbi:MAG: hypothetical protein KDK99_01855 [Verrucomicrobiales bacterium]|nr:hypothetical protein [Verrucomicrobiales bacterium]